MKMWMSVTTGMEFDQKAEKKKDNQFSPRPARHNIF